MSKPTKEQLNDEINEIIQSRKYFINKHYPTIRESFQTPYHSPQFEPLRQEICLCIMFGMCQAAITLTNHMLESLLKDALKIKESNKIQQTEDEIKGKRISALEKKFESGEKKYGKMKLNDTINHAKKEGLITSDQQDQLHQFRDQFRNAFGHADKKKTFGESTIPASAFTLEDEKITADESKVAKIATLPIGGGIFQANMAQDMAPDYFLYIDALVREIDIKLSDEDDD